MATASVVQRPTWVKADRIFFPMMSLVMLGVVLVGFARTYFLAGMVRAPLPNWMIHVHGALFSAWVVLLIVQTVLIGVKQVKLHRTLGLAGFGLAAAMVVMGVVAATDSLRRGFSPPGSGLSPLTFYAQPMSDMLMFTVLIILSYRARYRPAAHKRLILIATLTLMDAAISRWPFGIVQMHMPMSASLIYIALLLVVVAYDTLTLGKVQRVTWIATLFVAVVHLACIPIGMTPVWHAFARMMKGL